METASLVIPSSSSTPFEGVSGGLSALSAPTEDPSLLSRRILGIERLFSHSPFDSRPLPLLRCMRSLSTTMDIDVGAWKRERRLWQSDDSATISRAIKAIKCSGAKSRRFSILAALAC